MTLSPTASVEIGRVSLPIELENYQVTYKYEQGTIFSER
jgi:hypothetical protein